MSKVYEMLLVLFSRSGQPKNKESKHPHPDKMTNGEFQSEGGLEIYKLLFGLQGRVGKLEAAVGFLVLLMGAILAKLEGVY